MLLYNPFTGMVLNANPKGCNQYSGPNCSEGAYKALEAEAGIPLTYGAEYSSYTPDATGTILGDVLKEMGIPIHARIQVKGGRLERAVAAHEIGHHKSGHFNEDWHVGPEKEAWRWALKNRRRLAISKKKMRQAVRMAERSGNLPRNTFLTR